MTNIQLIIDIEALIQKYTIRYNRYGKKSDRQAKRELQQILTDLENKGPKNE